MCKCDDTCPKRNLSHPIRSCAKAKQWKFIQGFDMDHKLTAPLPRRNGGIIQARCGSVCDCCSHKANLLTSSLERPKGPESKQCRRCATSSSGALQFGQIVCSKPNQCLIFLLLALKEELCLKSLILNMSGLPESALSQANN